MKYRPMSKRKRPPQKAGPYQDEADGMSGWVQEEQLEALVGGLPPNAAELAEWNRQWREKLRASPLWIQMVNQFGPERAEQLLQQCEIKLK